MWQVDVILRNSYPCCIELYRFVPIKNPIDFKDWKNANTLDLIQLEVPVFKNFKKEEINLLIIRP